MLLLTMIGGGQALCGEDSASGAAREEAALKKAAEDTEKNRKSNATVRVTNAQGAPVAGAAVVIEQTRHDFLFGSNIYMFERFEKPEHNQAYSTQFAELLNYATTGFYWKSYEPEQGKPHYEYTDKVVAWCGAHGIREHQIRHRLLRRLNISSQQHCSAIFAGPIRPPRSAPVGFTFFGNATRVLRVQCRCRRLRCRLGSSKLKSKRLSTTRLPVMQRLGT
ncbi:MAG: hypothetical protein ABSE73_17085 [Planctomycetota bacterium]